MTCCVSIHATNPVAYVPATHSIKFAAENASSNFSTSLTDLTANFISRDLWSRSSFLRLQPDGEMRSGRICSPEIAWRFSSEGARAHVAKRCGNVLWRVYKYALCQAGARYRLSILDGSSRRTWEASMDHYEVRIITSSWRNARVQGRLPQIDKCMRFIMQSGEPSTRTFFNA